MRNWVASSITSSEDWSGESAADWILRKQRRSSRWASLFPSKKWDNSPKHANKVAVPLASSSYLGFFELPLPQLLDLEARNGSTGKNDRQKEKGRKKEKKKQLRDDRASHNLRHRVTFSTASWPKQLCESTSSTAIFLCETMSIFSLYVSSLSSVFLLFLRFVIPFSNWFFTTQSNNCG